MNSFPSLIIKNGETVERVSKFAAEAVVEAVGYGQTGLALGKGRGDEECEKCNFKKGHLNYKSQCSSRYIIIWIYFR